MNLKFRLKNLKLEKIKLLPNKVIHSSPIFLSKLKDNGKEIVLKFYNNKEIMQKEIFCNFYLRGRGLSVPVILFFNELSKPYVIMENLLGEDVLVRDLSIRIKDLARIHVNSLNDTNLNKNIPKFTRETRIKNLERNIKILNSNSLISKDHFDKFKSLITLLRKIDYNGWEHCFCFNDFFINNSMKSRGKIYYFDFEKATISPPFVDVGCIVINYPQKYKEIKSLYIKNIILSFKSKGIDKIQDYLANLDLFIDLGVYEKVIEDAAFLSNDSIKKTKSNTFCKKLAKKKIESVAFVFDNLKNSFIGNQ